MAPNDGQIVIGQDDFGTLCICAIRYCQGRETYMPSLVQGIVSEHIAEFSDKDIAVMLQDCEFQSHFGLYGDERIDKPRWLLWKKKLEKELEKRRERKDVSQQTQGD